MAVLVSDEQFDSLLAASAGVRFPQFWADLLLAVRMTHCSPAQLLRGNRPVKAPGKAGEAAERLWTDECPYGIGTSRFAQDALERGLMGVARRAGFEEWENIRFQWLC